MTPKPSTTSTHSRSRRGATLVGAGLLAAAAAVAAYLLLPAGPGDVDLDGDVIAIRAAVADDSFRDRPKEERRAMAERVAAEPEALMSDDPDARRARRNVFREGMWATVESFNTAGSKQERDAILDDFIDRMQAMREQRRQQREAGGDRGEPTEAEREEWRRRRDEGGRRGGERGANPARRAQMTEFWSSVRNRAEERGIEWRGRGGRGGGQR